MIFRRINFPFTLNKKTSPRVPRPAVTGQRACPSHDLLYRTGPTPPAMAEVLAALADGAPLARDRVLRGKVGRALDVLDRTLALYG